jgi:hypothetical protein
MSNSYFIGTCVLGALAGDKKPDWRTVLKTRPLSASSARQAIAAFVRGVGDAPDKQLATRELVAIDQSIVRHNLDPLPDSAADVLSEFMERSLSDVVVGAEPGLDINRVTQAVWATKPMTVAKAKQFLKLSIAALTAANKIDKQEGASARRTDLIRQLNNIAITIAQSGKDPVPEPAANILREAIVAAIVEYNAVAQMSADQAENLKQFQQDIYDNAVALAERVQQAAQNAADEVAWYAKATFWVGLGAVALVAYGGYRLLTSPTGHSLARHYLRGH